MREKATKDILVIDDNPDISRLIRDSLPASRYGVTAAETGQEGLRMFQASRPDLLILDLNLPDMAGLDILRTIRKTDQETPIFIVSGLSDEVNMVSGLYLGADEYMTKPFSPLLFQVRVDTFFKRREGETVVPPQVSSPPGGDEIVRGLLRIDPAAKKVFFKGDRVSLPQKDFAILKLLAASPERIFTRRQILQTVWGNDPNSSERMVDNQVRRLREKLYEYTGCDDWIHTVRGEGYRFTSYYELIK